jgi:acylphosphatase
MWERIESGVSAKTLDNDYLISIRDYALELGLVGIVFIKDDGSLKIIAEGEEEVLQEFAKELKKGNYFPIENFFLVWEKPNHQYSDFTIGNAEEEEE